MSFRTGQTLTRSQRNERAARRRAGQSQHFGKSQPCGTPPPPPLPAEAAWHPIRIVNAASLPPVEGRMLRCSLCGCQVLEANTRRHIAMCWKVPLRPDEPVPMLSTRGAVLRWIERHKLEASL